MVKRIVNILQRLNNKTFVSNSAWVMSKTLYCSLLGFVIGAISARYLGPANYGLIGYGTAYISIFTSISRLGLNGFIINDIVKFPDDENVTIGSGLILRLCASVCSVGIIYILILIIEADSQLIQNIVFIQSLAIVFHSSEVFEYWFKAKVMSKYVSIAVMIGYTVVGIWRIALLMNGASVLFFAASSSIEALTAGVIICVFFFNKSKLKLCFAKEKALSLLKRGKHMIVTALGVSIYLQTDKLMLQKMLGDSSIVGCYTVALTIATLWEFVPSAMIETATPLIIKKRKYSREAFISSYQYLLLGISLLAILVGVFFTIVGGPLISIIYGDKYSGAILPMNILIWSTGFAMIGTSRGIWMIQESLYKYSKYYIFISAIANVIINYFLIPIMGAAGAAIATLFTQIISAIIAPAVFPSTREFVLVFFRSFKKIPTLRKFISSGGGLT